MRHVLLHYHLFKCAGTSFDALLRQAHGERWVTAEFPVRPPGNPTWTDNSRHLSDWIAAEPDAVAFSTHTGIGPVPVVPGVKVHPVLFVREPLARIRSAYEFERTRPHDGPGVRLARENDLEGYARARLTWRHDRQLRDFQTCRLAAFDPGPGDELERALRASRFLPPIGVVEDFARSVRRLSDALPGGLLPPNLVQPEADVPHLNRAPAPPEPMAEGARAVLEPRNRRDAALHAIIAETAGA